MSWAAAVSSLVLAGCDGGKDTRAAEAAVADFHSQWDAGMMDRVYDEAAPEMKASQPKAAALDFMNDARAKLGKLTGSRRTSWKITRDEAKTLVILIYDSSFEKGKATETFTYRQDGGNVALRRWDIQSYEMKVSAPEQAKER